MIFPIKHIFSYLIILLLLTACSNITVLEGAAPGMKVNDGYAGIRMNSVAILDRSLQQWYVLENTSNGPVEMGKKGKIAVESTGTRRTPTNTLEAWAVLRNRTNFPLQIECKVQFFDENKAPLEGPTAWQRLQLPPNSIVSYKESSYNVLNMGFYYIEVREGE